MCLFFVDSNSSLNKLKLNCHSRIQWEIHLVLLYRYVYIFLSGIDKNTLILMKHRKFKVNIIMEIRAPDFKNFVLKSH